MNQDCGSIIEGSEICKDLSILTDEELFPIENIRKGSPESTWNTLRYENLRKYINLIEQGSNDRFLTRLVYGDSESERSLVDIEIEYVDTAGGVLRESMNMQRFLVSNPTAFSQYKVLNIGDSFNKSITFSNGLPEGEQSSRNIYDNLLVYILPRYKYSGYQKEKVQESFENMIKRTTCMFSYIYCKGKMRFLSNIEETNSRLINYRIIMLKKLKDVITFFNNQLFSVNVMKTNHYNKLLNNNSVIEPSVNYYVSYSGEERPSTLGDDVVMISPEESTRISLDQSQELVYDEIINSDMFKRIFEPFSNVDTKEGFENMNYNYNNSTNAMNTIGNSLTKGSLIDIQEENTNIMRQNVDYKRELDEVRGKIEAIRKINRATYYRLLASYLFLAIIVSVLIYVMVRA